MPENRLAGEASPYLLQHKDNPVDWYPWGPEALTAARAGNKPILLSVGYAACHWCHVMAHESFESPETAGVMNAHFINIKVDREERPDLDSLYQTALALTGQQGGWPLTMFLTPEGEPFWGGTYFPPAPSFGRPGFREVLTRISEIFHADPATVGQNKARLKEAMARLYGGDGTSDDIVVDALEKGGRQALDFMDWTNGGTRGAPKFPQAPFLQMMWRHFRTTGFEKSGAAVLLALEKMSEGGIYDHLAGGYARYTVDERWLVPHFEKMLYDNAQIVSLLVEAWRVTRKPLFKQRIYETIEWLLRDMRGEGGAFAASFDADSEGEEGRYYVWTAAEIDSLLGDGATLFKAVYDVTPEGNWEGRTILNRLAFDRALTAQEDDALAKARAHLLKARGHRVPPGRDDKILADWNGLVISALAEAAAVFDEPGWLDAARQAFDFIASRMSRETEGFARLHHSYRDGRLLMSDVADDYANMGMAALTLYDATQDRRYLRQAEGWAATARHYFEDGQAGGFYLSPSDADDLYLRVRSALDHAVPNPNGMLVQLFSRLYHLTYEMEHAAVAERTLKAFSTPLNEQPLSVTSLVCGLDDYLSAAQIVLVTGGGDVGDWLSIIHGASLPGRTLHVVETVDDLPEGHPARAAEMGRTPVAVLCRGQTCSLPILSADSLSTALSHSITEG
jgi:uncharacterized protein YyaL (SSP411 family)